MADTDSAIHLRSLSRPPTGSDPDHSSQDETPRHSSRYLPDDLAPGHDQHDDLPAYSRAPPANQSPGQGHSTTLHRSGLILFFTVLFAASAVYSWAILAILSFRPLSTRSWQEDTSYKGRHSKNLGWGYDARLYRSARVIQSILSVVILPWTSAVCAHAAVIYMQHQKDSMGLTMRQVMALADRRWLDISWLSDAFGGSWKQNGSALLVLAIMLHFLGAIIYPIQSIVVNPKIIHVPVSINHMGSVGDLTKQSSYYDSTAGSDVVKTRAALLNTDVHTYQPQLWQRMQGQQLSNFKNFSAMTDPFYAQIPSGFHTGVLQQFAPRINSSATSRSIQADEFPSGCNQNSSGFFANYSSLFVDGSVQETWAVTACMPNVTSKSPWVQTRNRQDFSELLYLNVSVQDSSLETKGLPASGALYEINLRTTAGYFELPNFMNNGTPGPLLESDPTPNCGIHCMEQTDDYSFYRRARRDENIIGNATNYIAQDVPWLPLFFDNKGPLLTTALALFGPGSFLETLFGSLNVVQSSLEGSGVEDDYYDSTACIDLAPLMNLFSATQGQYITQDTCVSIYFNSYSASYNNAHYLVAKWLLAIYTSAWNHPNIFTTAAFVSNKQWAESMEPIYGIYQDPGLEMEIPDISLAGVIVVSIFLGPYLLLLLALCWYGSWAPRWTHRLDSFVMLRFGAALGDGVFPMLFAHDMKGIKELDEIPGVIRDVGPITDNAIIPINRMGLWGGKPLQNLRRYECHEADNEAMTLEEVNQVRRGGAGSGPVGGRVI
ncbi:uncharacterized protein N7496_004120 [Penicillium cataractarum]|uniref:Uncharacterized protein n=1 Tax=Penicillium cataractarum TaxID=2100454 RepID=A0A9W9SNT1_9EURO|nr:uncharacterized protein N7496_004120 [Penicillium cataractarum]KAJ5381692.1 hypothetical protein N7496_004120 [Penicillium cataractarum]